MTQQLDFKEISKRDAWSTIRGFVFQVDYTILRWLELQENDLLELERGEDIDIIQRDLANHEISRELEQIKYREAKVTLNTDLTLELLKNFYTHKTNNPGKTVRFRFLTNAEYGHERPAIFTNGDKGIDRWISLYDSDTDWGNNETAASLQKHIQKKIAEQIISDNGKLSPEQVLANAEWKGFSDFIEDHGNFANFILSFEWGRQKENEFIIVTAVLNKIRDKFKIEDAKPLYERLFVFVFKLLSSKGIKQLDAAGLKLQGLKSAEDTQDHDLMVMLRSLLSQVDQRLLKLEQQSEAQSKALDIVFKDIDLIKNDTTFSYRLQNISTSAPEAIHDGSSRTSKVNDILDLLDSFPWLAFHGINGSGKTQMASLVSRSFQEVFWLDLREYHSDLGMTSLAIEFFLFNVSRCQLQTDKKEWVDRVIANLPDDCLLVFNDVPNLDDSVPSLNELFCFLINSLVASNVKLITTSNFEFPQSITQKCPEDCLFVFQDFEFDDQEISEYLVNQNAPDGFLKIIPFIVARAHRNPRLTTAMIMHLKAINWGLDRGEILEVVMNTEFATGLLENAQQAIARYIGDQTTKELLYRLSLISWTFDMDQILAVSKVEKQITHPNERLQPLLHLWIQLKEKTKFEISPLIQNIGKNNLDPEVVNKVHIAIGESILSGKTLNQFSANRAFMAFLSGEDFDYAGMVLLKMYQATENKEHAKLLYASGLLFYWTSTDFPRQMSTGIKVMIRHEQLRLYKLIDHDISMLLEHTKRALADGNATIPEGGVACLMLIINYFEELPIHDYIHYMSFVLDNLDELEEIISIFHDANMLSNLIWLPAMRLQTIDDIDAWVNIVKLALIKGVGLYESEISGMVLGLFCQAIVKHDDQSATENTGVEKLNRLLDFLTEEKKEDLAVYMIRGLAEVELKLYADAENAVRIVFHYLNLYNDTDAKFILSAELGKLYGILHDKTNEIVWYRKALAYDVAENIELIGVLLQAATAVSELDSIEAKDYCCKAVEIGKTVNSYAELDYILLLDELAVSHWLNGDSMQTFLTLEDIVARLFEIRKADFGPAWMRLFCLTGHLTGYCSGMLSDGKAPQTGGEDFFPPYQGMFENNLNDFSQHYQEKHDSFIFVQMAYIAAVLDEPQKAYKWALKGFDEARKNGSQEIFATVSSVSAHFAIINFRPTESFEAYLYNAAVSTHFKGQSKDRSERLRALDSGNVFTEKPSAQWSEAENTATTFAIVPLFIMLLTAFKDNRYEKNQMRAKYFSMLSTFQSSASDQLLFDLVTELSTKIMDNKISVGMLGDRANTFGHQERRNLQTICLLGIIHLTRKDTERLTQLINIVPLVQNIISVTRGTLQYTLIPFVQTHVIDIVKSDFFGSRDELAEVEAQILNVDKKDVNCLRTIINIARKVVEVDIPKDRQKWLNGGDF